MEYKPKFVVAVLLLSVVALDGKPYEANVATLSMDQAIERLAPSIATAAEDIALECVEDVKDQTDDARKKIASSEKPVIDRLRQIVKTSSNPTQKAEEAKKKLKALATEKLQTSITENVCDDATLRKKGNWIGKFGRGFFDIISEVLGSLAAETVKGTVFNKKDKE